MLPINLGKAKKTNKLNIQHDKLDVSLKNNTSLVDNYYKISLFLKEKIRDKLINLGNNTNSSRSNMDSQDEEKIYKILNHIKSNQNNLQNQLSMQYSVSNDLINNFNKSLETSRKIQLKTAVEINIKDIEVLHYKDLFNQLIILYNSVLYCHDKSISPGVSMNYVTFGLRLIKK
ncbi:hypothetical protein ABEB36_007842 [Hypothenemus hampei]|uniref:Uncharacterized protein n=1 Tax=Hypothenemus hampei TaxID=57062 RepID=A0ABD1EVB5_HYPHA